MNNAMSKQVTHYIDVPRHRIRGYTRGPHQVMGADPKTGKPRPTGGAEYYNTKPIKVYKHEIKPFLE